jgi:hypothetical protein
MKLKSAKLEEAGGKLGVGIVGRQLGRGVKTKYEYQ